MTIFGAQNLDKHYKRKSIKLQYWRSQKKHSRKSLETDSSGHVCVTHHGFTDHSYCWSISRLLRHTHTHTHSYAGVCERDRWLSDVWSTYYDPARCLRQCVQLLHM